MLPLQHDGTVQSHIHNVRVVMRMHRSYFERHCRRCEILCVISFYTDDRQNDWNRLLDVY